jgi:hypothetical protein
VKKQTVRSHNAAERHANLLTQVTRSAGFNLLYRRFPYLLHAACKSRLADKESGDTTD